MTTNRADWVLGVDVGTTFTSAAYSSGGSAHVVEIDGATSIPSTVSWGDDGLLVGAAALRQELIDPEASEAGPKRWLGKFPALLLGDATVSTVDAVGAAIAVLADEARRRNGDTEPVEVRLTFPAKWTADRVAALVHAAAAAGLDNLKLLTEPVATAMHFHGAHIETGDVVAVYDLGGGTFDTSVLRRTDTGYEFVGTSGGSEYIGGEEFDRRVFDFFVEQIGAADSATADALRNPPDNRWKVAAARLRQEARAAKEALSVQSTHVVLPIDPIGHELIITRADFEELIVSDVVASAAEFAETIERAGLWPEQIKARYLTGASLRIPVVQEALRGGFAGYANTYGDPSPVVALGAARTSFDTPAGSAVAPMVAAASTRSASSSRRRRKSDRRRRIEKVAVGVGVALLLFAGVFALLSRGDGEDSVEAVDSASTSEVGEAVSPTTEAPLTTAAPTTSAATATSAATTTVAATTPETTVPPTTTEPTQLGSPTTAPTTTLPPPVDVEISGAVQTEIGPTYEYVAVTSEPVSSWTWTDEIGGTWTTESFYWFCAEPGDHIITLVTATDDGRSGKATFTISCSG